MPVMYYGIMEEHQAVRNSLGIFDVSHLDDRRWILERNSGSFKMINLSDLTVLFAVQGPATAEALIKWWHAR